MKPRRSMNISGFTLLEVLVSTVLLSSVFVAVLALSAQSLRNVNRLPEHEAAMAHARDKMNQVLLLEELPTKVSTGYWDDGYRWQVEISPNPSSPKAGPNNYGLFDIRVTVFWGDALAGKSYVLETTQWAKKVVPNATN